MLTKRNNYWPNPFDELKREIDKLFGDFFLTSRQSDSLIENGFKRFNLNIFEDNGKFIVDAELPGIEKENIAINFQDDILTIKAKKEEKKENQDKCYYCKEIKYGEFMRSIRIDKSVDEDKIRAEFKNGVLRIELPIKEEERKKEKLIPIE